MHVCTSLQTDNHASTPPLSLLQAGCPSCRPTNSVKALKALTADIGSEKSDSRTVNAWLPVPAARYANSTVSAYYKQQHSLVLPYLALSVFKMSARLVNPCTGQLATAQRNFFR